LVPIILIIIQVLKFPFSLLAVIVYNAPRLGVVGVPEILQEFLSNDNPSGRSGWTLHYEIVPENEGKILIGESISKIFNELVNVRLFGPPGEFPLFPPDEFEFELVCPEVPPNRARGRWEKFLFHTTIN
jgi:hypothetical protein